MRATIPTRELVQVHELPRSVSERIHMPGRVFTAQGPDGPACIVSAAPLSGHAPVLYCAVHDTLKCEGTVRVQASGLLAQPTLAEAALG